MYTEVDFAQRLSWFCINDDDYYYDVDDDDYHYFDYDYDYDNGGDDSDDDGGGDYYDDGDNDNHNNDHNNDSYNDHDDDDNVCIPASFFTKSSNAFDVSDPMLKSLSIPVYTWYILYIRCM